MFESIKKLFTPPPPTPEELEEIRKKFRLELDMKRGMVSMEDYRKELRKKIAEMSSVIHGAKMKGLRQDLRLETALKVFQEELESLPY